MPPDTTFKWRDLYLNYLRISDPSVEDTGTKTVRIKHGNDLIALSEKKAMDRRLTGGKVEIVKAIFKCSRGYVVLSTLESHESGSIYYFR